MTQAVASEKERKEEVQRGCPKAATELAAGDCQVRRGEESTR